MEQLYDKATSGVQMNSSTEELLRTTGGVRVRQACLLSATLFNIFLERIMTDALEEHDGKISKFEIYFNVRNQVLTANLLKQGFRYQKLRK